MHHIGKKANRVIACALFAYLILSSFKNLFAQELHENFYSTKPLGMGNAYTAVANDDAAIWTNPAGIARARKARTRNFFTFEVPNLTMGANSQGRTLYEAQNGNSDKGLSETISENESLNSEKPYWANLSFFPIALFDMNKNLPSALGMYSHTTTKMVVSKETPDQAQIEMISDAGVASNMTWTNKTNRFSAGFQLRYNMRYAYEDTIPTEDVQDKAAMQTYIQEDANQSSGIGIDFGTMFTFADFWYPTLGVAVLNIPTGCKEDYLNPHSKRRETVCGTTYSGDIPNDDALSTVDPTDIRIGLSITPRLSRDISLRLALDAHHLAISSGSQSIGLSGIEAQKLIHAGMELFFANPLTQPPLALRLGVNQGFLTSGFSVRLGYFALDFATYSADISADSKSDEDRRYIGTFTLYF